MIFKKNLFLSIGLVILLVELLAVQFEAAEIDEFTKVAEIIEYHYESKLDKLPIDIKSHYAVRKYRITGDSVYISYILQDINASVIMLQNDIKFFDDTTYIISREKELLNKMNPNSRKGRQRIELFKDNPKMLFYLDFLYNTNKLFTFDISNSHYSKLIDKAFVKVKSIDYKNFLTDVATIRIYGAQAINYVYYLQQMGFVDYEQELIDSFHDAFPEKNDKYLSKLEFRDKLYCLTHFVIASSGYYQLSADSQHFKWITTYFQKKQSRIFDQATSDIIAEIGICFLLMSKDNDKIVKKCKDFVVDKFSEDERMILSPSGDNNFEKGEHRNILALLLLIWPQKLYPGPYIRDF